MTAAADTEIEVPKKKSKLPLILGLVLGIAGAGGGFMAVQMGLIGGAKSDSDAMPDHSEVPAVQAGTFIALDPILVNLPAGSNRQFLRFGAQLEVAPEYALEVEAIRPRIIDVLNSYLRAVELSDLEASDSLARLRAQMLRRVQVVAGEGRVKDLLVMEFVLN